MLAFMVGHLENGNVKAGVKYVLMKLDFPSELKGYRCLVALIPLYHADPEQSFTKELYPSVGRLMEPPMEWKQVEKDVRYAIKEAWKKRDAEAWAQLFPKNQKPSNEKFVSRISQLLGLWENCASENVKEKAK